MLHPQFAHYALLFTRAGEDEKKPISWKRAGAATGTRRPDYHGPREFKSPDEWRRYVGHYRNEDPWIGSHRIDLRKGTTLARRTHAAGARRRWPLLLRDEPDNPEWFSFSDLVNGQAMRMRLSGADLARV